MKHVFNRFSRIPSKESLCAPAHARGYLHILKSSSEAMGAPPTKGGTKGKEGTKGKAGNGPPLAVKKEISKPPEILKPQPKAIRPPKFKADPSDSISSGSSLPATDSSNALDSSRAIGMPDTLLEELILGAASAAATAAATAASDAVVHSLAKAYGLPLPLNQDSAAAEQQAGAATVSSTVCHMNEKWGCGNFAIKGKEGWLQTKNSGWQKLVAQCKKQKEEQQNPTEQDYDSS